MTSLARSRLNMALGLAIPAAGFLYLTSSGFPAVSAPAASVMVGVAMLWLAAVVRLNTLPLVRQSRVVQEFRDSNHTSEPPPLRAKRPAYVMDVSRPTKPRRWSSVLLTPLELLAVVWSVPVVMLLIMVPIGVGFASALWVGRRILDLF